MDDKCDLYLTGDSAGLRYLVREGLLQLASILIAALTLNRIKREKEERACG